MSKYSIHLMASACALGLSATVVAQCPGDFNGNDEVGFEDLTTLLSSWGPCVCPPLPGAPDTNGDGEVGFADLTALLDRWGPCPTESTIAVFDEILFYDGYADVVDEPTPEGVIRHSNSLYARKLTNEQVASIRNTLTVEVLIRAACDNYDRIGSVNLAIVPKGNDTYDIATVDRLEIGRFITPFMDMNEQPDTVPFVFELDHLVPVLTDADLLADYDMWLELSVFGVPYAAQNEIAGCAGHIDTFFGTLTLYSDDARPRAEFDLLLPLAMRERFNNYQAGASDAIGETRKTVTFTLGSSVDTSQFVLIISNHGANAGGEEYNRRDHFVYVDNELVLTFKPGRESCEPFRQYNTQDNGIYGFLPKTDAQWQAFSNWCPGDVIDNRIIDAGALGAGEHTFVIDVPDAVFPGGEGDFPFSLFFQAR
jgi:hypothetical protein